jgi:hypothetical protein
MLLSKTWQLCVLWLKPFNTLIVWTLWPQQMNSLSGEQNNPRSPNMSIAGTRTQLALESRSLITIQTTFRSSPSAWLVRISQVKYKTSMRKTETAPENIKLHWRVKADAVSPETEFTSWTKMWRILSSNMILALERWKNWPPKDSSRLVIWLLFDEGITEHAQSAGFRSGVMP